MSAAGEIPADAKEYVAPPAAPTQQSVEVVESPAAPAPPLAAQPASASASASATTTPEPGPKLTPWPPPDWKDDFVVSQYALLEFTNQMPTKLGLPRTSDQVMNAKKKGQKIAGESLDMYTLMFSTGRDGSTRVRKSDDFQRFELPEMPGHIKAVMIDGEDLSLLDKLREHYKAIHLQWRKAPHPDKKMRDVWIVTHLYVFVGVAHLKEMATKNVCLSCGSVGAVMRCSCSCVWFCNQQCKDRASYLNVHSRQECNKMGSRFFLENAAEARLRANEWDKMIKADDDLAKRVVVKRFGGDGKALMTADEHFRLKRAKLEAEAEEEKVRLGLAKPAAATEEKASDTANEAK